MLSRSTGTSDRGIAWLSLILVTTLGFVQGIACSTAPSRDATAPPPIATAEAEETVALEPLQARPPAPLTRPDTLTDRRSVAQRLEDASLAARIRMALVEEDVLRLFDFTPDVLLGQVLLRGHVRTRGQRTLALDIARQIEGVRGVTSEIAADEDSLGTPATPTSEPGSSPPETPAHRSQKAATYHAVQSGESLWTVARQHGVTIAQIKRLNNLRSSKIRPGQRLRVR
jgi:LysM repeat protein